MRLSDLLVGIEYELLSGDLDKHVSSIHLDSRKAEVDSLFFAYQGSSIDRHQFIADAIANGARTIICEKRPGDFLQGVTYIKMDSVQQKLGIIASTFYQNPAKKLFIIGVTGTNGKSSTVHYIFQLLFSLEQKAAMLSTIHNQIDQLVLPATHTTPDPISLQELFRKVVDTGCTHLVMEVSSHALDQGRVNGIEFGLAIFTNISHDHLDYHLNFQSYIKAKKKLFDGLGKNAHALVNADDKRSGILLQNCFARHHTYAIRRVAEFKAKILENTISGLYLKMGIHDFYSPLVGHFNAYNLLAAYAACMIMEFDEVEVLTHLSKCRAAEGRFQKINISNNKLAVVDYAHTPDALENVLKTVKEINKSKYHVLTVFGCGGNRDKTKRPLMGKISVYYSDQVIVTSDNPRFEDPEVIIRDIINGIDESARQKVIIIPNRKVAIETALKMSPEKCIILIAGKGHEDYQDVRGEKLPFSDIALINQIIDN